MDIDPYSIYVHRRPMRIAFLVDPASDAACVDEIIKYARSKWGGAYYPIVLTEGSEIADDKWDFLRRYDPDIVRSFVDLDDTQHRRIRSFLSPFRVVVGDFDSPGLGLRDEPISVLPTPEMVRQIGPRLDGSACPVVQFEVADSTPPAVKAFVQRNFGAVGQYPALHTERALGERGAQRHRVTDHESLNNALISLSDYNSPVVYSNQLCALGDSTQDVEGPWSADFFTVVVGDACADLVHFWNCGLSAAKWLRPNSARLWLPLELADNDHVRDGLKQWLHRHAERAGHQNGPKLQFVSTSLDGEHLEAVRRTYSSGFSYQTIARPLDDPEVPCLRPHDALPRRTQGMDLHRAYSAEEHVVLRDPEVPEGAMLRENWVADIQIEHVRGRQARRSDSNRWWQLPCRGFLPNDLQMFSRPARVNSRKAFSVLMHRSSGQTLGSWDHEALAVHTPDARTVFHSLICGARYDCVSEDQGDRFRSRPYYDMGV